MPGDSGVICAAVAGLAYGTAVADVEVSSYRTPTRVFSRAEGVAF